MDEYLCSDGIGIYQNASVGYPLSVVNNRLIVGGASNTKQVSFGCGVTVVYEEHVVRLSENGVEETIQYTQLGKDRASVTAAIDAFLASCALVPTVPPVPETINALNCTGAATPTTFPDKLDRVVIVQDKPFVICPTPQIDVEHRTICNTTTDTWHYITVVYTNGVETSNTSVNSGISCKEPLPLEPDIEQLRRCNVATGTIFIDVVRYMTDPVTNVTTSTILSSVDTLEKCNEVEIDKQITDWLPICVAGVQWYVAEEYSYNNTTGVKTLVGKIYKQGANGAVVTVAPTGIIIDGACELKTQRQHENFVVTGTTTLVIPAGAISISVTKTNNTGIVNISGDNGTNFPLTFNRENFGDAVNEGYSTLSAYTITGTLAGTTYKVHIIR